jgi:hypothetical protein
VVSGLKQPNIEKPMSALLTGSPDNVIPKARVKTVVRFYESLAFGFINKGMLCLEECTD